MTNQILGAPFVGKPGLPKGNIVGVNNIEKSLIP
jgi:hypothetical protein